MVGDLVTTVCLQEQDSGRGQSDKDRLPVIRQRADACDGPPKRCLSLLDDGRSYFSHAAHVTLEGSSRPLVASLEPHDSIPESLAT
jgi:hypothetical protein